MPNSNMESVEEFLDWYEWSLDRSKEENIARIKEMKAALERREERLKIQGQMDILEKVLKANGWTDDSDIGLIAISSDPTHRFIADELLKLNDRLKTLDGQEK